MEQQSSFGIPSSLDSCDGLHRDAGEELGHLVRRTHHPDPPPALHPEPDRELELEGLLRALLLDNLALSGLLHLPDAACPIFCSKVTFCTILIHLINPF